MNWSRRRAGRNWQNASRGTLERLSLHHDSTVFEVVEKAQTTATRRGRPAVPKPSDFGTPNRDPATCARGPLRFRNHQFPNTPTRWEDCEAVAPYTGSVGSPGCGTADKPFEGSGWNVL